MPRNKRESELSTAASGAALKLLTVEQAPTLLDICRGHSKQRVGATPPSLVWVIRLAKKVVGVYADNLQSNSRNYLLVGGASVSTTHGQKFWGFAVSLPDLMTLIFAIDVS